MSKYIIINIILDKSQDFYHRNQKWEQQQMQNDKLRAIVNYLIGFFYETEKKYSCSITKIGKLLSILAFKAYIESEERILGKYVAIKKYKDCGTYIPDIFSFSDINNNIYVNAETITTRAIYEAISSGTKNTADTADTTDTIDTATIKVDCQDTNKQIKDRVEYNKDKIPPKYILQPDELTVAEKELIKTVFLEYGAFSPDELGKIIGDFCQKAAVYDEEENVDLEVVRSYRYTDDTEALAIFIGSSKIE